MRRTFRANSNRRQRSRGFTLIEILAIAPVIILVLAGIIGLIINLTGSSMVTSAKSQLQSDVLTALDRIEADVRLSTTLEGTTSSYVRIHSLATSENPYSSTRRLIQKSDCGVAWGAVAIADAKTYTTEYFQSGSELKRKTMYDGSCPSASDRIWQLDGAVETIIDTSTVLNFNVCKINDGTLKVSLGVTKTVAGENIQYSSQRLIKSINVPANGTAGASCP